MTLKTVKKYLKAISCSTLSAILLLPFYAVNAIATDNDVTLSYFIDSVNGSRLENYVVVYTDRESTEQNEWGYDVVVGADGKVNALIPNGDSRGRNLAIPDGGMIVSAHGKKIDWLEENIEIGDFVFYDSVSSRILVSSNSEVSPYYSESHTITGFNQPRNTDTFIIYDNPGSTQTNGYGYEICVNAEGTVIVTGGNDNEVPEGGFVVSAINSEDKAFLKMYGIIGATAKITKDKNTLVLSYGEENLKISVETKLNQIKDRLISARENYLVVPYDEIEAELKSLSEGVDYTNMSLRERNELFETIDYLSYEISEKPAVELRSVWHGPVETNLEQVHMLVQSLKNGGINQLVLCISNGYNSIMPLPEDFPFKQKTILTGTDLLAAYVAECKNAGIELVVSIGIFRNSAGSSTPKLDWLVKSNGIETNELEDKSEYFYNPANDEVTEYLKEYIVYILNNYAIDGLQLDYIRYPQSGYGLDYGYDDITKSEFAEKYNLDVSVIDDIAAKTNSHELWDEWCAFKAEYVTSFVSDIRLIASTIRPDVFLSAAVSYDTRLSSYCQDTKAWINYGYLDALYPMTYGEGVIQGKVDEFSDITGNLAYLFMGSGTYLNLSNYETFEQAIQSRYKADGICYFEYTSFISNGTFDFLSDTLYSNDALSPTFNATEAAKAQISFMFKRIDNVLIPDGALNTNQAAKIAEIASTLTQNLNISTTDNAIESIKTIISETPAEAVLLDDLNKLRKIIYLSKDTAKAAYLNDESTISSSETSNENSNSTEPERKSLQVGLIIFGTGILFVAAVFVIVKIKNSK